MHRRRNQGAISGRVSATMTCRHGTLAAIHRYSSRTSRKVFTPVEIVTELKSIGSQHRESTNRTHIVSRTCSNAPDHHAVVYDDLERVGPGKYRLRTEQPRDFES